MSLNLQNLKEEKLIIGMIHLLPLPGSPGYDGNLEAVFERALADLNALQDNGVSAAIVENFGDVPYDNSCDFVTLAAMTAIAARLKPFAKIPLGLNVQFNQFIEEWDMAYAAGYDFIRVEAFVETRVGTHGITYPAAPKLMREKGRYPADIKLLCDINTKHTTGLVDMPVKDAIHSALEEKADALIVTGLVTGQNPTLEQVKEFKDHANGAPVILGSGINKDNVADFLQVADGAIVGSSFKIDGNVFNGIDPVRVKAFMENVK